MGVKHCKIMFRPPKVFRQYGFVKIPDHDFLQKTLILGILFFWDTRYKRKDTEDKPKDIYLEVVLL